MRGVGVYLGIIVAGMDGLKVRDDGTLRVGGGYEYTRAKEVLFEDV